MVIDLNTMHSNINGDFAAGYRGFYATAQNLSIYIEPAPYDGLPFNYLGPIRTVNEQHM